MKRRTFFALFAALALVGAACGGGTPVAVGGGSSSSTTTTAQPVDSDSPEARLAAGRARWADVGPAEYVLTRRELCFCPETIWIEAVVDGGVTSHEPGAEESFYDPGPRTMDDLFDEVQAAIDAGYATFDLEVAPETGALVRYWVDVDEGTADQTLGLYLHMSSGPSPDVSGPIELPDGAWTAELLVGRDLFSNHCDDVVEVGEPEPVVTETWAGVAGTLTVGAVDGEDGNGPNTVAGILTGAVVESGEGERIELDDIELRNDCWGCFAG